MGIRKGQIVRVLAGNKPIGRHMRVEAVDGPNCYCNEIENGKIKELPLFFLKQSKLTVVPSTGVNVPADIIDIIDMNPVAIVSVPAIPMWEEILIKKKTQQDMVLHLYCNGIADVYVKFITAVHTTNSKNKNVITLFNVEKIC